ncbi:MAG: hypothetical protein IJF01_07205 [Tidjanibacter sp.]|nr:hypothetical protein [Tidjanibacter sp.]
MQERNVLSGAMAVFTAPLVDAWDKLVPFFLLALLLTFMDLRYGILAARKRNEKIRKSRAIRRTLNKIVDFICYLSLAWCFGHTFTEALGFPILPFLVLMVIYGIEFSSVLDNYFEYKGSHKRINFDKLLNKIFRKYNIEDIIEDEKQGKDRE